MTDPPKDYAAIAPCGCMVGAVSGDEDPKWISQCVAKWIRQGCQIERVTPQEVRERFGCVHREKQRSLPGTGLVIEDDGEGEAV